MPNRVSNGDTGSGTDTAAYERRAESRSGSFFRPKARGRFLLYGVLAFLILSYALSFAPKSRKAVRRAFMSGADAASLEKIEIENGDEITALYKKNGVWYGSSGGAIFPAESAKVSELAERLTKARNLYTISDSVAAVLDKNKEYVSILFKNDRNMSTKVYFCGLNFDRTRRFIRMEGNDEPYACEIDCDAFLRADAGFWIDPYIVPQKTEEGRIRSSDIQLLRMEAGSARKTLSAGTPGFSEKAENLLSLRHGGFSGAETSAAGSVFSFTVETGKGFRFTVSAERGDAGQVFLLFDSFQNTVTGAKYEYRYRVSVSAWTLEKLTEVFG